MNSNPTAADLFGEHGSEADAQLIGIVQDGTVHEVVELRVYRTSGSGQYLVGGVVACECCYEGWIDETQAVTAVEDADPALRAVRSWLEQHEVYLGLAAAKQLEALERALVAQR